MKCEIGPRAAGPDPTTVESPVGNTCLRPYEEWPRLRRYRNKTGRLRKPSSSADGMAGALENKSRRLPRFNASCDTTNRGWDRMIPSP